MRHFRYIVRMISDTKTLPDDPGLLKDLIASLTVELTAKDAELTNRDLVIARLEHQPPASGGTNSAPARRV